MAGQSAAPLGNEKLQSAGPDPQAAAQGLLPPNDRGVAIGIAAGVFGAFALLVLAGVMIYRLRRRAKPDLNLKSYQ
ncbi:hypothetical protein CDD83_5365 [Cordyceps sp. RAO-2017]|nr:hypothetical protein CDD83_5365 [Cordyceps sp. RAO-2017]